jgi:iron complex outermembrane receptor protein/hemoglobin/transferrin/lactoferrin receptor protein
VTVSGALYGFQQGNAPRTDQCPPPEAPASECLEIASQDRTLAYLALRGDPSPRLTDLALILSWQNHHEVRRKDRPRSSVRFDSTDDVDTLGLRALATTPITTFWDEGALSVRYGLDYYADSVSSESSQSFTDIDRTFALSRGQYVEGSTYVSGGLFTELEARFTTRIRAHAGARAALVDARSPADAASATRALSAGYGAVVGRAGVATKVVEDDDVDLGLYFNWDQGFRAPNLDDLTSRQQAGPGFQFENPDLTPERTNTFELGAVLDAGFLRVEGWGFATILDDAIVRAVRNADDCPVATPECTSSRAQYQLVNAVGAGTILGAEGGATVYLPADVTLRATISYAWGETPGFDSRGETRQRVPLSRVPPLNGTVEARWRHLPTGIYTGAALRWATDQTRLAPSDLGDARIPIGGTPGYAVLDLRAGIRWSRHLRFSVVFENVFDAAYRLHGSSIDGAGRGVLAELMLGL